MTRRQEAFYWCLLAYAFAVNGAEHNYKGYKRSATLLLKVMNKLKAKLTLKQIDKTTAEAVKLASKQESVNAYDFMDYIVNAMVIIRQGNDKKLNSLLALAATNVQEEIET